MSQEHRDKIKNSNILNNLISAAEGKSKISSTQATVGIALMKKVMPDLQAITLANEGDKPFKTEEVGQGAAKLSAALDAIAERASE